jgi:hypothetical protein
MPFNGETAVKSNHTALINQSPNDSAFVLLREVSVPGKTVSHVSFFADGVSTKDLLG